MTTPTAEWWRDYVHPCSDEDPHPAHQWNGDLGDEGYDCPGVREKHVAYAAGEITIGVDMVVGKKTTEWATRTPEGNVIAWRNESDAIKMHQLVPKDVIIKRTVVTAPWEVVDDG